MYKTLLTSAAVLATTAYASSPGSAVVVNGCNYPVQLSSVPASGGGYDTTEHTLQPQGSYTQQWTQLSNGAGWSIKLAKESGASSVMQYEYTFNNDGTIWYDLSCVDGNPWDGNWEISASGDSSCSPRQAAYRYSTDDAYGEQSCPAGSSITVTLCSGESQNDGLVSSVAAAQSSAAPAPTTSTTTQAPAPAPTTSTTTAAAPAAHETHSINWHNNAAQAATTLTTATTTPTTHAVGKPKDAEDNVVYVYETVVETAVAYETYVPGKRHVHHPDHPHFR